MWDADTVGQKRPLIGIPSKCGNVHQQHWIALSCRPTNHCDPLLHPTEIRNPFLLHPRCKQRHSEEKVGQDEGQEDGRGQVDNSEPAVFQESLLRLEGASGVVLAHLVQSLLYVCPVTLHLHQRIASSAGRRSLLHCGQVGRHTNLAWRHDKSSHRRCSIHSAAAVEVLEGGAGGEEHTLASESRSLLRSLITLASSLAGSMLDCGGVGAPEAWLLSPATPALKVFCNSNCSIL